MRRAAKNLEIRIGISNMTPPWGVAIPYLSAVEWTFEVGPARVSPGAGNADDDPHIHHAGTHYLDYLTSKKDFIIP